MFGLTPPVSPRDQLTAVEDAVSKWLDSAKTFALATMRQQISVRGMTDEKALRIRQQEWRKA